MTDNELRIEIALINNPKPDTHEGLRHFVLSRWLELKGKNPPALPASALEPVVQSNRSI